MKFGLSVLLVLFLVFKGSDTTCQTGCAICSSFPLCDSCSANYTISSDQTQCRKCPANCETCDITPSGKTVCTFCYPGFQTGNGTCFKCHDECRTCAGIPEYCTSCFYGLYPVPTYDDEYGMIMTCQLDQNCIVQNCGKCVNGTSLMCEKCKDGFFEFRGACLECQFPCGECFYPAEEVYFYDIVPFLEDLRNQSGARRLLQGPSPPPQDIDVFTMNLYNVSDSDMESIAIGKLVYDAIFSAMTPQQAINVNEILLVATVQAAVNEERKLMDVSLDDRLALIVGIINAGMSLNLQVEEFGDFLHEQFFIYSICERCLDGFSYINQSDYCQPCEPGCKRCDGSQCLQCIEGAYPVGNECRFCDFPCWECTDQSTCNLCEPPFTLNNAGSCQVCNDPCVTCQTGDPDYCESCMHPFSARPGAGGVCFTCEDFLCEICPENDITFCHKCLEGALARNGTCEFCSSNCIDCDIWSMAPNRPCFECDDGYFVNSTEQCQPCGKGCLLCTDSTYCQICRDGLYPDAMGICKKCPGQCKSCDENAECTEYEGGKIMYEGFIIDCRPGCENCDLTDPEVCLKCDEGYLLMGGYCEKCTPGCDKCSSPNNCTECDYGFVQVAGDCLACHYSCLECNPLDVNQCTKCRKGLAKVNGTCVHNCRRGCFECDPGNSTHCYECDEGFTLKDGDCRKCLGDCNGYCNPTNILQCLGCSEGFQLVENSCVRCPDGCTYCEDGDCYDCMPNFYLDETPEGRLVCVEQCKFPCQLCDHNDVCHQCLPGFILSNGNCAPDFSCNPTCVFCPPGTLRNNVTNNCEQCSIPNCAACDEGGICYECFDGYYSNGTGCEMCSGNCEVCMDDEVCLRCSDGYLLEVASSSGSINIYGTQCSVCNTKCAECIFEPDFCIACHTDFKLNGTTCIGFFTVGFNFVFNFNFTVFLETGELQTLLDKMVDILQLDIDDIVINSLAEGSVAVGGAISASSSSNAQQTSSSLTNSLNNLGYDVVSSDIGVYYNDAVYTEQTQTPEEDSILEDNVGLIVGLTVGLIVLVAIIIFAVYQYKKKKSEQIEARDDDIDNDVLERNQGRENSQMNIGGGANTKVLYN